MSVAAAVNLLNSAKSHLNAVPPDRPSATTDARQAKAALQEAPGSDTHPIVDWILLVDFILSMIEDELAEIEAIIAEINSLLEAIAAAEEGGP